MIDRSDATAKPVRVVGIDLGTTNSTIAEARWAAGGAAPKVRCVEVEQATLEGTYASEKMTAKSVGWLLMAHEGSGVQPTTDRFEARDRSGTSTLAAGDPRPVTMSYPGPAEKAPLLPLVTSRKSRSGS